MEMWWWYDPDTGRFISEDPAQDGLNWYVYAGNNPLKYTDPTGLKRDRGDRGSRSDRNSRSADRTSRRESRQADRSANRQAKKEARKSNREDKKNERQEKREERKERKEARRLEKGENGSGDLNVIQAPEDIYGLIKQYDLELNIFDNKMKMYGCHIRSYKQLLRCIRVYGFQLHR